MDTLEAIVPVLKVLAHPVRLKLIEILLSEQISVGELAKRIGVPPNVASQHLNTLRAHGVVAAQRQGQTKLYEVIAPEAANIINCIRLHHC